MDKRDLGWMLLVSVIILIILSFSIPVLQKTHQDPGGSGTLPPVPRGAQGTQQPLPGPPAQEEEKQLKTVVSIINIGLIIPLLIIYLDLYRTLRSSFTLSLVAVIAALGMYAVTSCPLIIGLLGGRTGDTGLFTILPDLFATAALLILVRISYE